MARVDCRLRHREELARQRIERLIFLRWTAHVVSMITLTVACAACVLEASEQTPRPSKENQKTGGANQQPTSSPRGSYYDPVVVEIKPTAPTNYDANKEREQKA